MSEPKPAPDLTRLPKWAQEYISDLQRERAEAVRALNTYCDEQTPSEFYIDEMESTGEQTGPSTKRRYIRTHRMAVEFKGVRLDVILRPDDSGIDLGWDDLSRGMKEVAFVPVSFNRARLISKENMR